jgi:hypothetical protein
MSGERHNSNITQIVKSSRPGLTWKCYRCCFTCGGAVKPTCVCVCIVKSSLSCYFLVNTRVATRPGFPGTSRNRAPLSRVPGVLVPGCQMSRISSCGLMHFIGRDDYFAKIPSVNNGYRRKCQNVTPYRLQKSIAHPSHPRASRHQLHDIV